MRNVILLVISAAGLAACNWLTGPSDAAPAILTDATAYVLEDAEPGWRVDIPHTFTNRAGGTVRISNCHGTFGRSIERWEDGDWVAVWHAAIPLCNSAPIVIGPGATHMDTAHFFAAPPGWNLTPEISHTRIEGTFRIVWRHLEYQPAGGEEWALVPKRLRTSNAFTFRLERPED